MTLISAYFLCHFLDSIQLGAKVVSGSRDFANKHSVFIERSYQGHAGHSTQEQFALLGSGKGKSITAENSGVIVASDLDCRAAQHVQFVFWCLVLLLGT